MKKCWDPNPENRPTAEEIRECLDGLNRKCGKIIEVAETRRQGIIKSEKYLIDEKNHKDHPESFYTSRPLSKLIQQANSLSISSNEQDSNIDDLYLSYINRQHC